jgi:hypothetical protein
VLRDSHKANSVKILNNTKSDNYESATGKSSVISSIYKRISNRSTSTLARDASSKTPDSSKISKSAMSHHVRFELTERQQAMYIQYIALMNNNFLQSRRVQPVTRTIKSTSQKKTSASRVVQKKVCHRHMNKNVALSREELLLKIQERKKTLLNYIKVIWIALVSLQTMFHAVFLQD